MAGLRDMNEGASVLSPDQFKANALVDKARAAAAVYLQYDQDQVNRIVDAACRAAFDQRIRLARMACEETGLGVLEHKVLKNVLATMFVCEQMRHMKTVGEVSRDDVNGIVEIAQPLGPIMAVTPVTNPTSTVMFKILISLKTRNPIIISPAPRAMKCCTETARVCYEAALAAGAPEDCIQVLPEVSRGLTHAIMTHKSIALVLATGGPGLVEAAYSSGTPAIGVGPGNVPVFIDRSADIPFAVDSILISKTFDNGTICASEQAVVVEKAIAAAVVKEFESKGGYFLKPDETKKMQAIVVDPETGMMSPAVVGQPVEKLAKMAGIAVPPGTKLMLARLDAVGRNIPISGEVLAPVIAYYECPDFDSAIKRCIELNYLGGIGHTASVFSNDPAVTSAFADMMNAGRVMVNTPSSQGAVGGLFNRIATSFTLGCGAGGKNITTENIGAHHLINIKRVCSRRNDERWARCDVGRFLDEKLDFDAISTEYNRNF